MVATEFKCAVCGINASQRCGGCGGPHYCSKGHQKQHWSTHKKLCKVYKVLQDDQLGRYIVANRDIKMGEVVIRESPLLKGPAQVTSPVCLGCLQELDESSTPCERCGWPMCSIKCQDSQDHEAECKFTVKHKGKVSIQNWLEPHPLYQMVTPIRILLMRGGPKQLQLDQLESHCEKRKGSNQWLKDKEGVELIKRFYTGDSFTEKEILRASGILQVNAHELPLTDPPHIAVYQMTSLTEHSCLANCCKSFNDKGEVIIWASQNIARGEHISICYTDPLWGTENRQSHLYETKLFNCICQRCSDPTELGSMFSAVKCKSNNCNGLALPVTEKTIENVSKKDSNDNEDNSVWKCQTCDKEIPNVIVQEMIYKATHELRDMEKGCVETCIRFLSEYSQQFPPSHYIMTDVRMALAHLLGSGDGLNNIQIISVDRLKLKATLCNDLIALLGNIAPGECRARGSLFFELHATLAEQARRGISALPNTSPKDTLQMSLVAAQEASGLLLHESQYLPEGMLCLQANRNIQDLKRILTK